MNFARLVVFGFLVLSVIYVSVALYSRSVRKERLENQFDEDQPNGTAEEKTSYVNEGMRDYEQSFRRKLIWLVYVIPVVAIVAILMATNSN